MSSFMHTLSDHDRDILRKVVKMVHMKHYPKDFCTDYEADKMIAAIAPQTLESLKEVGKKFKVDQL
jgi:hypothetical protein